MPFSQLLKSLRVALMAALLCSTALVSAQEMNEAEKGVWKTGETKAKLAMGKLNRIVIRSASAVNGSIEITTGFVKEAQLTYVKTAKTESRKMALDYLDALSVSLDAFGGKARLEFRAPNPAPWSGSTDAGMVTGKLLLPKGTFVEIEASSFDIKATGPLAGLVIINSLGQIEATRIDSLVDITTANQKVVLDQISGDISVTTTNAPLVCSHISTSKVPARFKNESGDVKLDSVNGSINVRSSFGKIAVTGFNAGGEGSTIKGASGPISIALTGLTGGPLVVSNKHEDVELLVPKSLSAYLSLSTEEENRIEATGFVFRTELVQRDRLNLVVGKGEVNVNCTVKGQGSIYVRGVSVE
ncbi:MAG: hypothetical protein HY851_11020 [candidate division Zixibacteria bacterium]|nr:hypothetical protein [candidate division Zixibacteria bacterium]